MAQMCNISEGIFERAMSRGMAQAGFRPEIIAKMIRRSENVVLEWIKG